VSKLQKQHPNNVLALINLAKVHQQKGELAEAAAAYEQAVKLNPKLPDVTLKLAQLYAGPLHKPDEAIAFARKARELAPPNDTQSAAVLCRIAFQAGNFSWAYSLLQESARQNNKDATVLRDLGLATYALGKVPEARQAMERAMNVQPNGPQAEEIKRFLAMTALDGTSADVVAAQSSIQRILKTEPDYVPALMVRAAIQRHEHEAKAATETYSKVLQEYPDFAPAQKHLAAIYAANLDNQANAYDLAMNTRKTLTDPPQLALTLAEISFNRNEFPYAIQLFQQSAAKQALPAKDLYYLGMAQLQTRQEAKGRETLQRALSAGLQNPMAEEAKKRLAEQQR
jgi:tetratricopeptide (TPR) repeat protein